MRRIAGLLGESGLHIRRNNNMKETALSDGSIHGQIHIGIARGQHLRQRKARSTNCGILQLILVHKLEFDDRIRIIVRYGYILVPHGVSSSIHMSGSLARITIRLYNHIRILLAPEKLSFSEIGSIDNGNTESGHGTNM